MSCGDSEAAAEFNDVLTAAQVVADHPRLGALIQAPEHLRPNLRAEIIAASVEPETQVAYPPPSESAYDTPGLVSGYNCSHPKFKRGHGSQVISLRVLAMGIGYRCALPAHLGDPSSHAK